MAIFQYETLDTRNEKQIHLLSDIWHDPETRKYFPGFNETIMSFEDYVQNIWKRQNVDRRDYFSIYHDRYIGWLNINSYRSLKISVELMYAIHPHFRKQHLGNEMVRLFLEELKRDMIQHVEAQVGKDNYSSQKILLYNQFKQVELDRKSFYFWKKL